MQLGKPQHLASQILGFKSSAAIFLNFTLLLALVLKWNYCLLLGQLIKQICAFKT